MLHKFASQVPSQASLLPLLSRDRSLAVEIYLGSVLLAMP